MVLYNTVARYEIVPGIVVAIRDYTVPLRILPTYTFYYQRPA